MKKTYIFMTFDLHKTWVLFLFLMDSNCLARSVQENGHSRPLSLHVQDLVDSLAIKSKICKTLQESVHRYKKTKILGCLACKILLDRVVY